MGFPNKEQIEEVLNSLTDEDTAYLLPKDASDVDKIKFDLCKNFVVFLNKNKMTQVELATRLGVDKSRINWIVKYRIENFSIDFLYALLKQLNPNIELRIYSIAA